MKYDPKYDDYEMAAIALEGSENWPSQWNGENDASFQKYKAAVDRGQKVSAKPFLAAQARIYANMTAAERHKLKPGGDCGDGRPAGARQFAQAERSQVAPSSDPPISAFLRSVFFLFF